MRRSLLHILCLTLALVWAGATPLVAQQAERVSPPPPPSQNQTQPAGPAPPAPATGLAATSYLTPIAGYQGVLAETADGGTIASQAVEEKFNPASAVKLATALVALQTFGPDHRFITAVWRTGSIDPATATLNGDLIITGRDPSFHYEHAVMLTRQLNDLGIRTVNGNLIVAPGFTMNFSWSAQRSAEDLRETLDAARRTGAATRAWLDERVLVGDNASLSSVPSVVINGEIQVAPAPAGAAPLLMHKSSKLLDVLKVLLCYSNNFMAERIGDALGGPLAVTAAITKQLKIAPDEVSLATTSGLGI